MFLTLHVSYCKCVMDVYACSELWISSSKKEKLLRKSSGSAYTIRR